MDLMTRAASAWERRQHPNLISNQIAESAEAILAPKWEAATNAGLES